MNNEEELLLSMKMVLIQFHLHQPRPHLNPTSLLLFHSEELPTDVVLNEVAAPLPSCMSVPSLVLSDRHVLHLLRLDDFALALMVKQALVIQATTTSTMKQLQT